MEASKRFTAKEARDRVSIKLAEKAVEQNAKTEKELDRIFDRIDKAIEAGAHDSVELDDMIPPSKEASEKLTELGFTLKKSQGRDYIHF